MPQGRGQNYNVYLSAEVVSLLYEEEKGSIEKLETEYKTKINIIANPEFAIDRYQVEAVYGAS